VAAAWRTGADPWPWRRSGVRREIGGVPQAVGRKMTLWVAEFGPPPREGRERAPI